MSQVLKLIAGPNVHICDECVDLCLEIIAEEIGADLDEQAAVVVRRIKDDLDDLRDRRAVRLGLRPPPA